MLQYRKFDVSRISVLLCDADGNLFPSEEPAFVASAAVTNQFMQKFGLKAEFTPTELRLATTGKNFRTTALTLAVSGGVPLAPELAARYPELARATLAVKQPSHNREAGQTMLVLTMAELDGWVEEEKRAVTAYLSKVLSPDPPVIAALARLKQRYMLAIVSSSATSRVAACLEATRLASFFPEKLRFSAEDSLAVPTSKPDPAIYRFAGEQLKIASTEALAIEDSVAGAQAATAAGYPTIGNMTFVPQEERAARIEALKETGVVAVIFEWGELVALLDSTNQAATSAGTLPLE